MTHFVFLPHPQEHRPPDPFLEGNKGEDKDRYIRSLSLELHDYNFLLSAVVKFVQRVVIMKAVEVKQRVLVITSTKQTTITRLALDCYVWRFNLPALPCRRICKMFYICYLELMLICSKYQAGSTIFLYALQDCSYICLYSRFRNCIRGYPF